MKRSTFVILVAVLVACVVRVALGWPEAVPRELAREIGLVVGIVVAVVAAYNSWRSHQRVKRLQEVERRIAKARASGGVFEGPGGILRDKDDNIVFGPGDPGFDKYQQAARQPRPRN